MPDEQFGQPDPQVERAKTSVDEIEGYEFVDTDAGSPADGWTNPPEGHTAADTDTDDILRRKG